MQLRINNTKLFWGGLTLFEVPLLLGFCFWRGNILMLCLAALGGLTLIYSSFALSKQQLFLGKNKSHIEIYTLYKPPVSTKDARSQAHRFFCPHCYDGVLQFIRPRGGGPCRSRRGSQAKPQIFCFDFTVLFYVFLSKTHF